MGVRYLDKNSSTPLYRQLANRLEAQIKNGEYQAGDRLPSERELSELLNVSRITARQAIVSLEEDGLIYREQGRGTFVAEPRQRHLRGLTSFTEDMLARGCQPSSRILVQELVAPSPEQARDLKLEEGELALHLVRLRLADGKPIALQSTYISQPLCPGIEHEDFSNQSLFAILREKFDVYPMWTEVDVEALHASSEEAHLLEIKTGDPLLVVRGKTLSDTFDMIEIVRTAYRGKGMALYIGRQRLESGG